MNLIIAILNVPDSPLTHLNLLKFGEFIEEIMLDGLATVTPRLLYLNLGGIFMFDNNISHFYNLLEVLKN